MPLISALILIVSAAAVSSVMAWQGLLGTSRVENNRDRDQAAWIARAAASYAQWVLEMDTIATQARSSALIDHLSEPWAQTLSMTSLGELFAGKPEPPGDTRLNQARLGGQIHDLQSRLNLAMFMREGRADQASLKPLRLLFKFHNLSDIQLRQFISQLEQSASRIPSPGLASDRRQADSHSMLWRQKAIENALESLGLPVSTKSRLSQQLTWLAAPTQVNVNTADPEVIAAVIEAEDVSITDNLAQIRQRLPFLTIVEVRGTLAANNELSFHRLDVSSSYFVADGVAEYGKASIRFQSWHERLNGRVNVVTFRVL